MILNLQLIVLIWVPVELYSVKKRSQFTLLDREPEDLLYFYEAIQEWRMCKVNKTVVDLYSLKNFIEKDCYKANMNKEGIVKHAWFLQGTPDTVDPTCNGSLLPNEDTSRWNCEKGLSPFDVTPYRNCSPACNNGYSLVNSITVRCGVNLDWIWFGEKSLPYCIPLVSTEKSSVKKSSTSIPITSTDDKDLEWNIQNLSAVSLNSSSVKLSWNVTANQHSNTSIVFPGMFRLTYNSSNGSPNDVSSLKLDGRILNYTLTNLTEGTEYYIRLCITGKDDDSKCPGLSYKHMDQSTRDENSNIVIAIACSGTFVGVIIMIIVIIILVRKCRSQRIPSSSSYVKVHSSEESSKSSDSKNYGCIPLKEYCPNSPSSEENTTEETSFSKKSSLSDNIDNSNMQGRKISSDESPSSFQQDKNSNFHCCDGYENGQSHTDNNKTDNRISVKKIVPHQDRTECENEHPSGRDNCTKSAQTDNTEEFNTEMSPQIVSIESLTMEDDVNTESSTMNTIAENTLSYRGNKDKEALLKDCNDFSTKVPSLGFSKNINKSPKEIECSIKPWSPLFEEDDDLLKREVDNAPCSSGFFNININRCDPKSDHYCKDIGISVEVQGQNPADDPIGHHGASQFNISHNDREPNLPPPDSWSERLTSLNERGTYSYDSKEGLSCIPHRDQSLTSAPPCPHHKEELAGGWCTGHNKLNNVITEHGPNHILHINEEPQNVHVQGQNPLPSAVPTADSYTHSNIVDCPTHSQLQSEIMHPSESCNNNDYDLHSHDTDLITENNTVQNCVDLQGAAGSGNQISTENNTVQNCVDLQGAAGSGNQGTVECTLKVTEAKEDTGIGFFMQLGYYLDPDTHYGQSKSWYGLTIEVLSLTEAKVKSIRHHTLGNPENGHFLSTLSIYAGQGRYMADIVRYFVQPQSCRPDVVRFIKEYHTDCPVCDRLYLQITRNNVMSQSTEEIRLICHSHHHRT